MPRQDGMSPEAKENAETKYLFLVFIAVVGPTATTYVEVSFASSVRSSAS